jgi:putative transposase
MDNHYHLLIEAPEANLSRGMRQLNGVYTQRFNRRHHKVGRLFQGRYKPMLAERDSYLLELSRYIVLNPVRAKIVKTPETYPWSSYRANMGLVPIPPGLTTDWVLGQFAKTEPVAHKRYAEFVHAGIGKISLWKELKGQVLPEAAESKSARNDAMAHAHLTYGYTLAEISKEVRLHYASISRHIKAVAQMH